MDEKLRAILQESAGLAVPAAGLDASADLYAVGLSSLATVRVMLAIEQAFDIEFPDALLTRSTFQTIATLRDAVGQMQTAGAAA